jgi:hypothetical protein
VTPFAILATALYLLAAATLVYAERRGIDLAVPILCVFTAAVAAHLLSRY